MMGGGMMPGAPPPLPPPRAPEDLDDKARKWQQLNNKRYGEKRRFGYVEPMKDHTGKIVQFFCKLCDCKFNDINAKNMHLKGRRHRLQFKKKVNPELEVDMKPIPGGRGNQRRHEEKLRKDLMRLRQQELWSMRAMYPDPSMTPAPLFARSPQGYGGGPGGGPNQSPDSMDDRHVMAKHEAIYPTDDELKAVQAIVNNVETMCNLPHILKNGVEWYRQWGTEKSPGFKIFSISGHVNRPGNYEVPLGTPMMDMIEKYAGGGRGGKKIKAVIPGGSSTPLLTGEKIRLARMDYESIMELGSFLGSGGITVLDEDTDMVDALWNLMRFYHHESCGQCTPCRDGTGWMEKLLARIDAIRDILTSDGRSLVQGALGWLLARSEQTIPSPGIRTVAQAVENAGTLQFGPLAAQHMAQIDALLRAETA